MKDRRLIVVMGPSGCGKSTLALALTPELRDATMIEADEYHSEQNRSKMAGGVALSDADREPWIEDLCNAAAKDPAKDVVLACSALTRFAQERLRNNAGRETRFILLQLPKEILMQRLAGRSHAFMPESLLESQLAALDPPIDAYVIDATKSVAHIVERVCAELDDKA